jgi:hypothetical protein
MILPLDPMPVIPVYDPTQEHSHPGAFGFPRHHFMHTGIDLYAPMGAPIHAMEAGRVVQVAWFTGPNADSPWWRDTRAVYVDGESGVITYGEVEVDVKGGNAVVAGQVIAYVLPVLNRWKGRPMSMLHLELCDRGWMDRWEGWDVGQPKPEHLKDPTDLVRGLCLEFVAIDPYAKEAADWAKRHPRS